MSLYIAGHSCRENMSFDRHTLLHSFPGDGREPTSNRKYYLVSSGDMMASQNQGHAISTASAAAGWQPSLSTIVNVKVLRQQSPTAECPSVGCSSNPEVSDVRYRTEAAPCMQPASRSQLSDMVGHGRYVQGQSTLMSPRYQSPVGQPVLTVPLQHSADIPASLCQQMMINRRAMEEDVLPRASNRPSVLQQLTDELQEQKWRTSNMHAYTGSPKPSVVKPVPVKVQPGSTPRFHPLMSGPSHMSSSAVEPSAAQIASRRAESYKTTQSSSAAADFLSVMRSPRSQPNLQHTPQSPPSRNIESHSPHCMSINQSVNVSQSLQFGSLDRSPTGRWHPASGRSVEGSYFSPTRSASGLTSDVHEGLDLTCTAAHHSPVRCCQSQNYSPRQHGVVSPQNRGSAPRLLAAHTQMRSQELLSARLSSPRHFSPDQHAAVSSPANLALPGYSHQLGLPTPRAQMQSRELHSARLTSPRNVSPKQHAALSSPANFGYSSQQGFLTSCSPKSYSVQPHSSVSDASSRSRMSSDLPHGLGSPVRSRSSQDSMSIESSMQHAVGSPSKLISPTQVNCLPLI